MRRLLLPIVFGLTGCTLGPDYQRPDVPVPGNWREIPVAESASFANTAWWDVFDDPVLQDLIRIALDGNRDLRIAAERVEEARARYGFSRSYLWPSITAGDRTPGRAPIRGRPPRSGSTSS